MKNWFALLCALPLVAVAAPERIVALGGDVTEIVYALGAESSLVARDSTSQWPQATNALPDVGYLRQLNAEGILSVRPTLVLASDQAQPSLALKQVEQSHVRVVTVPGTPDLRAIDEKVRVIAQATHHEAQGETLRSSLRQAVAALPSTPLNKRVISLTFIRFTTHFLTFYDLSFYRQFVRCKTKSFTSYFFRNACDFKHDFTTFNW